MDTILQLALNGLAVGGTHKALVNVTLLAALTVALLGGCSVAPLTPTTEVGPDHGVVVFRLATNVAPAGFFTGYDGVYVVSDAGIFQLSRTSPGVIRTGVFTGALLPGQYRISEFKTVGQNVTRSVTVPRAFGSFTVKAAGQLTDLGTLVFQPSGGSVMFARTRKEGDTRELVAAAFPRVAAAVLARPLLDWDASPDTENLAKTFAAMRATVAPVNGPGVAPSGAVYAGSALGQVLVRRPPAPRGRSWTRARPASSSR